MRDRPDLLDVFGMIVLILAGPLFRRDLVVNGNNRRPIEGDRLYRSILRYTLHFHGERDGDKDFSPAHLKGKAIGVQGGTIHLEAIEKFYPESTAKIYQTQDEALQDLIAGRIDYALGDLIPFLNFLATSVGSTCCETKANLPIDPAIIGPGGQRQEFARGIQASRKTRTPHSRQFVNLENMTRLQKLISRLISLLRKINGGREGRSCLGRD